MLSRNKQYTRMVIPLVVGTITASVALSGALQPALGQNLESYAFRRDAKVQVVSHEQALDALE